jgi:rod shape-determining protein MreC
MENFFARYKNPLVLMAVLFIQVVALATQVKRQENSRVAGNSSGTRLIRVWTVTAFTPVQKMFVSTGHFFRDSWHNYADLRGVRRQNRDLQAEVSRLQMEQARLKQDADQARRLQALLDFKERFVGKTVAAQVIGTSGTEQSRVITIDKGSRAGIKTDMAVITPDGIVGKVKEVFPLSSQVLLINDHDSGAGVILEASRLQGILKGNALGELQIGDIMSDEKIEAGERVITSGGDRIFPKGLPVGTVSSATPDRDNDPFLSVKIKPSADLRRLEEVMVITKVAEEEPAAVSGPAPMRAADILSQRLPSVPKPDANAPKTSSSTGATTTAKPTPNRDQTTKLPGATAVPGVPGAAVVKTPSASATPARTPLTATQPAGGATAGGTGASAAAKPPEAKNPAGAGQTAAKPPTEAKKAGQAAATGTSSPGAATPTPTPKPKVPLPKKQSPAPTPAALDSAPEGKKPDQPESRPAATPAPTPEKAPR